MAGEGLLEGLVTNVFAISGDGALLTAPVPHVLAGHMRQFVIDVWEADGGEIGRECVQEVVVMPMEMVGGRGGCTCVLCVRVCVNYGRGPGGES